MSMDPKNLIAKRVAEELNTGDVVNLGIGLPMLVANHVPQNVEVVLQSENGLTGLGPAPSEEKDIDPSLFNAGGQPITITNDAAMFDSAMSFAIIRGGHVDMTVLGALQVDQEGSLANWIIPGKKVPGMGGAMDLVTGAKKVVVAMTHTARGSKKILKKCELPYTAVNQVDMIVTELCVLQVTSEGLLLTELFDGVSVQDVKDATDADFKVAAEIRTIKY